KKISDEFEKHKATTNEAEKKKIYAVIDSLSQEASKYAVFQEYQKMVSSIGAKRTNAFTSNEKTVYINTIPSNQIDKWLTLESERFSKLVLRLFHTELETVYEEFNTSQSSDSHQAYYKFNKLLFPTHPYGTQTTLGKAEHLKNPSMVNIHNYWNKYYVANNMAIIMTGDLNPDDTIVKIDKYFGDLRKNNELTHPTFPEEKAITKPIKADIYGPEAEFIQIGFRTEGADNEENIIAELIGMILFNRQAGLIDINLVKSQKVLKAYAYNMINKDYGSFTLKGNPLEGQSLEEVEKLLLFELEKIKKGEFDDWLQEAIINYNKLFRLRQIEYNYYTYSILNAFTLGVDWSDEVSRLDKMEKITKQQIVDYANKTFKDNYVTVYKRKGENQNNVMVDKPEITPLVNDRDKASQFCKEFSDLPETRLKPEFVNYKEKIKTSKIDGVEFNYIQNKNNELTSINFILDMGQFNIKELELAVNYFQYAGSENYSAEELAEEYFKLGVYTGVYASGNRSYIDLSGLNKNFEKALILFIENLKTAKVDKESFDNYIGTLKKERSNEKLNKWQIEYNLNYLSIYGKDNPLRYCITNKELENIDSSKMIKLINQILDYKHYILYYGPKGFDEAYQLVNSIYNPSKILKELPEEKNFTELENSNKVYFLDYDMIQSNITLISKDEKFNEEYYPY
ncbi:MAG: insulinase family protein, partial [Candidatus Cloacimonetes bacterium]|nr:insulinase family protein [Candidatus Cloacimonadota bacterium]